MEAEDNGKQVALRTALGVNGTAVVAFAGFGLSMAGLSPPEFTYARWCFAATATLLGIGGVAWLIATDQSLLWRLIWGGLLGLAVFVAFPLSIRWINERQESWVIRQTMAAQAAMSSAPTIQEQKSVDPGRTLTDQSGSRLLSNAHVAEIGQYLYSHNFYKLSRKVTIFTAPVYGDISSYANQFQNMFTSIGMEAQVVDHLPTGPGQNGVMIAVTDVTAQVILLEGALTGHG